MDLCMMTMLSFMSTACSDVRPHNLEVIVTTQQQKPDTAFQKAPPHIIQEEPL